MIKDCKFTCCKINDKGICGSYNNEKCTEVPNSFLPDECKYDGCIDSCIKRKIK